MLYSALCSVMGGQIIVNLQQLLLLAKLLVLEYITDDRTRFTQIYFLMVAIVDTECVSSYQQSFALY